MCSMRLSAPTGMGIGRWALIVALLMPLSACATSGSSPPAMTAGGAAAAPKLDDDTVRAAIIARWDAEGDLDSRLTVGVRDGKALLAGRAANADERVKAVRLAWQADGVAEVINEIGIGDESSLTDKATDLWITTQLRTKLLTDSEITSRNYSIETVNQVIYLMGRARSGWELDRVRTHARDIARVRQVVSHVELPR